MNKEGEAVLEILRSKFNSENYEQSKEQGNE